MLSLMPISFLSSGLLSLWQIPTSLADCAASSGQVSVAGKASLPIPASLKVFDGESNASGIALSKCSEVDHQVGFARLKCHRSRVQNPQQVCVT